MWWKNVVLSFLIILLVACGQEESKQKPEAKMKSPTEDRVQVRLLTKGLLPDKDNVLRVGLHFEMAEDWHIYWKNPGDSGLPTRVDWTLPEGYSAGPILWPTPHSFEQPGEIQGYGYSDEVLLIVDIQALESQSLDKTIRMEADVNWLACADVCIPGGSRLVSLVETSGEDTNKYIDVFDKYEAQLPKSLDENNPPFTVSRYQWPRQTDQSGAVEVALDWNISAQDVAFFPHPADALLIENLSFSHQEESSTIRIDLNYLKPQDKPRWLDSVIGYRNESGDWRGISQKIPLQPGLIEIKSQ
ncbi:MAG: protein-disulfide reductase DsbD domain-containing protein [Candidatus Sumerlaeia bacterium]